VATTRSRPRGREHARPSTGGVAAEHAVKIYWVAIPSIVVIVAFLTLTGTGHVIDAATQHFMLYYAGVFALIALCASVGLGLIATDRMFMNPGHRVFMQAAHRAASFGAVGFLIIHIVTEILAQRVHVLDAVVPFLSPFRTFYIGLGTISSDLIILLLITGIMRARFTANGKAWWWRAIHYTSYVAFVFGIWHGLLAGRPGKPYVDWSYGFVVAFVLIGLAVRILSNSLKPKESLSSPPVPVSANSASAPMRAAAMFAQLSASARNARADRIMVPSTVVSGPGLGPGPGQGGRAGTGGMPVLTAPVADIPAGAGYGGDGARQPYYEPGYEGPPRYLGAPPRPAPRAASGPMPQANTGPMTQANTGPMTQANTGPMPMAGTGPMPRGASGPLPRAGSGPMPRAASGPMPRLSGPMERASGPMERASGPMDRASGPMDRASGPMPRADYGPPPRAASGPMRPHPSGPMPRADYGLPPRGGSGPMPRADYGPPPRAASGPMRPHPSGPIPRAASGPMDRATGPMPRAASGPMPWAEPGSMERPPTRPLPPHPSGPLPRVPTGPVPRGASRPRPGAASGPLPRAGGDPRTERGWQQGPGGRPQANWGDPSYDARERAYDGYGRGGYDPSFGGYDGAAYEGPAYDRSGYDQPAYDRSGYDRSGYDRSGYDRSGYDGPAYDGPAYDGPYASYEPQPPWDGGLPEPDPRLKYREPGPGMPGYRGSRDHRYGGDRR
jgi:DMSO/TMAO reductase YedYZ heme-binding membrane subunit